MAATGLAIPVWSLVNSSGAPLSGAKVNSWVPDSNGAATATRRALYTDPGLTTPAANPYTLGTSGHGVLYRRPTQAVALTITDSAGVTTYASPYYPIDLSTTGGASLATFVVSNNAALTALAEATGLVDNGVYQTLGRSTERDGGEGLWVYDSAATDTANGGTILAIDGGGAGRFFRSYNKGHVNAAWFGSLSSAFATAVNAAIAVVGLDTVYGGIVDIPKGAFAQSSTITVTRGVWLRGPGKDVCQITQSASAKIIIGGSASTTYRAGISDIQVVGQNGVSTSCVQFDRVDTCFARDVIIAGVDGIGVELGTTGNPSGVNKVWIERVEVGLDAANASAYTMRGGGAVYFIDANGNGASGQGHTCYDINNTAAIDTIYMRGAGCGDCDYGFRWRGSENLSNVLIFGGAWDRCAQGAMHLVPTGTPSASDWIFAPTYFSGVGSTTGVDAPVVYASIGAGRSLSRVTFGGLIKDGRHGGVKIEGAGTVADINFSGVTVSDCGRAAAGTYPAIWDATTSGIEHLRVMGCLITNNATTYSYGVRVDTAGTNTNLKDVIHNSIGDCATANVYFGGTVGNAGVLANAPTGLTSIADDAVLAIATLAASKTCKFSFNSPTGYYGYAEIETTGTATIVRLADSHADVEVSAASGVPTGTTGTDVKITIYVNTATNIVYIENRIGAALVPTVALSMQG